MGERGNTKDDLVDHFKKIGQNECTAEAAVVVVVAGEGKEV